MSELKSLCAKIPLELHNKITSEKDESGMTLNDYVTKALTDYYEIIEKGGLAMAKEPVKTLAIHISPELMDRVKVHLKKTGVSQKAFIVSLIEKALEDAENVETPTAESE